jgi:TolB-like protein
MSDGEGQPGKLQSQTPQLRTMGNVRLLAPDGSVIPIKGRRTRGLLVHLALVPDQSATRERLCGLLWSDRSEPQARSSLRQCLFELNAAFKGAAVNAIDATRDGVRLVPAMIECDVAQFEAALVRSDAQQVVTMIDAFGQAQLLEDLELGGMFREWQEQMRGRVNMILTDGVLGLLDRLEGQGDWLNVKRLADAWLRRDPLEENVVASAIRADLATGAPAVAHRRFHAFEALLEAELGIAPGAAIRAALADGEPAITAPRTVPSIATAEPLLAVLAFDNLSSDPEMEYFSEGISEEILQNVSKSAAIRVIARASSFQFRGRDKVTSNVSAELGATHLLDGSVRRSGDRVRITAALVNCADQTTLWSGRFDRDLSDIFALQDEIAQAVAEGLNVIFAPSKAPVRIDPEAHDLYLRARHLASSPPHVTECITFLEAAVAREPSFAAAWSSLAMARAVHVRWMAAPDQLEAERQQAILVTARATTLNPVSGLPLVALSLLEPEGRFAAREALLERAMVLSPDDSEVLKQVSDFAGSVGRVEEAHSIMMRAARLDPLNPHLVGHCIFHKLGPENREPVYREITAMRNRWPDYDWAIAMPLLFASRLGDWHIVDELLKIEGTSREWKMAVTGANHLRLPLQEIQAGAREAAERQIAARGSVEIRTMMALYSAGLCDEAFDAWARSDFDFRRSYQPDSVFLLSMIFGILNVAIRKDIRFMDLCQRLGLCDYWVETNRWPDCATDVSPHYDLQAEARRRVLLAKDA